MKSFKLDIAGLVLRFYLMMAVVLIGGFTGQWWIAIFALPIFLSAMMGITVGKEKTAKDNVVRMKTEKEEGLKKIAV